jgi:hypothetical protein
VLIDRQGVILGYYDGLDEAEYDRAARDLQAIQPASK